MFLSFGWSILRFKVISCFWKINLLILNGVEGIKDILQSSWKLQYVFVLNDEFHSDSILLMHAMNNSAVEAKSIAALDIACIKI